MVPSDLCTIAGTAPHCLVKTERNVNSLGTRSLFLEALPLDTSQNWARGN